MSPLYIRTILKDVSASLYIQRILAIASSGREREARSSSKATKFGGPPGENEFPGGGGEYSPIKVTGVLVGKFQEHPQKVRESCFTGVFQIYFHS